MKDLAKKANVSVNTVPRALNDKPDISKALFDIDQLPKGSMRLADLGYFSLEELASMSLRQIYWLSRIQAMCAVFDSHGERKEVAKWLASLNATQVQLPVRLGVKAQLPCRFLAMKV